MIELLKEIEAALPAGGDWCTMEKAATLAAMIVATRPRIVVEIGVWRGGSAIPMALALKANGIGKLIAIDAWDARVSMDGETPVNQQWWGNDVGQKGHDEAYHAFVGRVTLHGLRDIITTLRAPSDSVDIRDVLTDDGGGEHAIDLLHVDGSHTDQAMRDVERFGPLVRIGGTAVLDDVGWDGGGVGRAVELARAMGFVDMYPLGTGIAMQRRYREPSQLVVKYIAKEPAA